MIIDQRRHARKCRINQEEGAIENLIFNFDVYEDYSNSQQLMEIVYDNSIGQEENVSMVIHDVEDEASPS